MSNPNPTSEQPLSRDLVVPDGPAWAARLLEPLLAEISGEGAAAVSINYDFGPVVAPGAAVVAEAWIDRATRTIVFAGARLKGADGAQLAQASAVFRRVAPPAKAE